MNEDLVCKRELEWWEHYPLHQLWCNDYCPLVPRFYFNEGDEWNANNYHLHWLIFTIWTMEHFSFGVDAGLSFHELYVGAILPWLRITVGVRHLHPQWLCKLSDFFRRKPAVKNKKGEYN